MFEGLGSKLTEAVGAASDAGKRAGAAVLQKGKDLAEAGAGAVAAGMQRILDSDMASAAALSGASLVPGIGTAVAVIGSVAPNSTSGDGGVMVTLATDTFWTVTPEVPLRAPLVARTVAEPNDTAVSCPVLLIVAMAGAVELHATV